MRSIAPGMNSWPEKPGWMLMQRTRSKPAAASAASCTSVSGLIASPTWKPRSRACAATDCGSETASRWNVTLSAPAVWSAPK